jgi:hypothetical protein
LQSQSLLASIVPGISLATALKQLNIIPFLDSMTWGGNLQ